MSQETRLKMKADGRVVIPASFRRALGVRAGDEVVLRLEDNELRITTMKHRVARAQRLVRKHIRAGVSLVDELIADRRKEAKNE